MSYPPALLDRPRQSRHLVVLTGAGVARINPDVTALDGLARFNPRGPAARVLPALMAEAWPG